MSRIKENRAMTEEDFIRFSKMMQSIAIDNAKETVPAMLAADSDADTVTNRAILFYWSAIIKKNLEADEAKKVDGPFSSFLNSLENVERIWFPKSAAIEYYREKLRKGFLNEGMCGALCNDKDLFDPGISLGDILAKIKITDAYYEDMNNEKRDLYQEIMSVSPEDYEVKENDKEHFNKFEKIRGRENANNMLKDFNDNIRNMPKSYVSSVKVINQLGQKMAVKRVPEIGTDKWNKWKDYISESIKDIEVSQNKSNRNSDLSGEMYKQLAAVADIMEEMEQGNKTAADFVAALDELNDCSENYLNHKAKDGYNEKAIGKISAAMKIRKLTDFCYGVQNELSENLIMDNEAIEDFMSGYTKNWKAQKQLNKDMKEKVSFNSFLKDSIKEQHGKTGAVKKRTSVENDLHI